MSDHIFITGVTGFVGMNLLKQFLVSAPDTYLTLLVRAESQLEAQRRINNILDDFPKTIDRVKADKNIKVITGDISRHNLGLENQVFNRLAQKITHIIHSAASISFDQSLSQARRINVQGTQNVIQLAKKAMHSGKFKDLSYISTAYVCGDRDGNVYENDLDCGQKFSNSYEQSKFEAELLLRQNKSTVPITIFRPSIIVGDSETGKTSAFNVLYYPLKLISRGFLRFIPAIPEATLDVVPVNYVCAAIFRIISSGRGSGKTFHLTSGSEKVSTLDEIVELAVNYFNQSGTKQAVLQPKFVSPYFFPVARFLAFSKTRQLIKKFEQYRPYMKSRKNFDDSNTRDLLSNTPVVLPHFREYCNQLLNYCLKADWGRNLITEA